MSSMTADTMTASPSGLAYREFGTRSRAGRTRQTAVLLHGIPGSSGSWSGVAAALGDEMHLIVADLLGFGASDRPDRLDALHADAQAAALAALFDELRLDGVLVAGHDFGGPVAVALAARRPHAVAGLALFAANVFTDTPIPLPLSLVRLPLVGRPLSRVLFSGPSLALMLHAGSGRPRMRPDHDSHLGDRRQQHAIRTIFAGSLARLEELYRPIEDGLAALDVPVVVGWGDRDPFFGVDQGRRTAEAVGAELTIYADAGHFLPQERPVEVAAELRRLAAMALPRRPRPLRSAP
jgi:pimeloyl-ACP methyl ester carboxylesterase